MSHFALFGLLESIEAEKDTLSMCHFVLLRKIEEGGFVTLDEILLFRSYFSSSSKATRTKSEEIYFKTNVKQL